MSPDEWLAMGDVEKLIGRTFPREVVPGLEPSVAPPKTRLAAEALAARPVGPSMRARRGGRRSR
jgi:hypothetical protein